MRHQYQFSREPHTQHYAFARYQSPALRRTPWAVQVRTITVDEMVFLAVALLGLIAFFIV